MRYLFKYIEDSGAVKEMQRLGLEEGDTVKKGQCIAAVSEENLGADIHSSINGKVDVINDKFIIIVREGD